MQQKKYKIGLEVHVQLNTDKKLFSFSINKSGIGTANQNVSYFDIGSPGTYPYINPEAVTKAIRLGKLLNCEIAKDLSFDRKHYVYIDLPIGYQITQQFNPIGINGTYQVFDEVIKIQNIHLETDAGKIKKYNKKHIIDFNRCGVPLVEIVTDPTIREDQIDLFISMLIFDLKQNNISNAKMELGNIRVDVNISRIIDETADKTTCRIEIKNINSVKFIKKAIKLAKSILENKTQNCQDITVLYDDATNSFVAQRKKESAQDYMYMQEPLLYPVKTSMFQEEEVIKMKKVNCALGTLYGQLPQMSKQELIALTDHKELLKMAEHIIRWELDTETKQRGMFFLYEIKEIILKHPEEDTTNICRLVEEALLFFVQGKSTKVNTKEALEHIAEHIQQMPNATIGQYLKEQGGLISGIDTITDKQLEDTLNQEDETLIIRLKLKHKNVVGFAIGLLLKKFKTISPKKAKEILAEYISKDK